MEYRSPVLFIYRFICINEIHHAVLDGRVLFDIGDGKV